MPERVSCTNRLCETNPFVSRGSGLPGPTRFSARWFCGCGLSIRRLWDRLWINSGSHRLCDSCIISPPASWYSRRKCGAMGEEAEKDGSKLMRGNGKRFFQNVVNEL